MRLLPHTHHAQGILVSYIGKLRNNTTRWTDERVRLAGEAVSGCLAVKMLGRLQQVSSPNLLQQRTEPIYCCCWKRSADMSVGAIVRNGGRNLPACRWNAF